MPIPVSLLRWLAETSKAKKNLNLPRVPVPKPQQSFKTRRNELDRKAKHKSFRRFDEGELSPSEGSLNFSEAKEEDILYQKGDYWVKRQKFGNTSGYGVYRDGATHATLVARIGYPGEEGLKRAKKAIDDRITPVSEANGLPEKRVKNGVTQYPVYNGKGEVVWVTVPPRPQDEDTDGIVTEENDRIPRKPTRNRWFRDLVQTHKELPARYRDYRDDFTAESGDHGTLHKIATFAHEHGLGTKLVQSPYEWDSTSTLTISGFSK